MDKFRLQWNDFQTNVSKSFNVLRKEEEFFDVTLVSDDEQHIQAHKLILSASSDFFKNILTKSNHSNPLIFLPGMTSTELNRIMDYIYQGEVQLLQGDLDSFLDIANKLKISGLHGADTEKIEDIIEPNQLEDPIDCMEQSFDQNKPVRKQPKSTEKTIAISVQENESSYEEARQAVDELIIKDSDIWSCKTCGKTAKTNTQMRKHAEIHIEGLSFPCSFCDKTFRSRKTLCNHKQSQHKN